MTLVHLASLRLTRPPAPRTPPDPRQEDPRTMTRSRASARAAGTRFERTIADHLATRLDDHIDRRPRTGARDKGDIGGVRTPTGARVVIECKDYGGRLQPAAWLREAATEAANDDAAAGIVIAKRRGTTNPGAQYVLMTVDTLITLLKDPAP